MRKIVYGALAFLFLAWLAASVIFQDCPTSIDLDPEACAAFKAAKILRRNSDSFKLVSAYAVDNHNEKLGDPLQVACVEFWKRNSYGYVNRYGVAIPSRWDGKEGTLSSGDFLSGNVVNGNTGTDGSPLGGLFMAKCRGQIARRFLDVVIK
jgi:hypothetical protein